MHPGIGGRGPSGSDGAEMRRLPCSAEEPFSWPLDAAFRLVSGLPAAAVFQSYKNALPRGPRARGLRTERHARLSARTRLAISLAHARSRRRQNAELFAPHGPAL